MNSAIIRVEGLSKRYRLGEKKKFKKNLGELLSDSVRNRFLRFANLTRRLSSKGTKPADEFLWALKSVSFQVGQGEVVGIIGSNGAGKSTLLKILSRITDPTEGRAEVHGRVGSLLEVGTGFHSELTGRENIYLNGAILGMKKAEISRKFDEIVAFSEMGKFLDTPVKHYSSGMYMRLAFAVAAHLEPEILIVDEVLAVGDAAFQKKCLGKMGDVASEGRTVLFVSHNMAAVQGLCDRVIWLQEGQVREDGSTGQVVSHYLQTCFSALTMQSWDLVEEAPGNDWVRLRQVSVRVVNCSTSDPITVRTPFLIEFQYWSLRAGAHLVLTLHLYNEQGVIVFNVGADNSPNFSEQQLPSGLFQDVCRVPGDFLNDGMYRVELWVCKGQEVIFKLDDALIFEVHDSAEFRGNYFGKWGGVVRPVLEWTSKRLDTDLPAPLGGYGSSS